MLYCGNCVDVMKEHIKDNSIDLTVTSPPYDNLRVYNGYTFDFEAIAQQLYRVTKIGGIVVWVVNDATVKGSETGTSFKQALYFKDIGFNLHDTMIYHKESQPRQKTRNEQHFEYMFVFSKNIPKTTNIIQLPCKLAGSVIKRKSRDKGGDILLSSSNVVKELKNKGNVWYYSHKRDDSDNRHPAKFPEQLAHDHIVSWSNEGDIILDPMCGSGTTLKMAKILNRRYIGIDISQEYINISQKRLDNVQNT